MENRLLIVMIFVQTLFLIIPGVIAYLMEWSGFDRNPTAGRLAPVTPLRRPTVVEVEEERRRAA